MSDVSTQHKNYRKRRNNPVEDRLKPPVMPLDPLPSKEPEHPKILLTSHNPPAPFSSSAPDCRGNVIRRLKRGQYAVESTLDLHGLRRFEADDALDQFISEALQLGLTCVLIIHGKGYRSENRQSVLKQFTVEWLKEVTAVKGILLRATQAWRRRRHLCITKNQRQPIAPDPTPLPRITPPLRGSRRTAPVGGTQNNIIYKLMFMTLCLYSRLMTNN